MIIRILLGLAYAGIGALAVGWWHNRAAIDDQRQAQIAQFMSKGARFTAQDGQELCERVRALEQFSYGFKNSGLKSLSCNYYKKD